MDLPAVHLLLLEQGDHSLEYHMRDFLDLVCLTHYSLCKFFHTGSTSGPRHACPWMFLWEISQSPASRLPHPSRTYCLSP